MGCLEVAVADCDLAIHRSLQRAIQKESGQHFAGGAFDGVEAHRLIREKQPDVMIIDMVLPKLDGFTLIEEVRKDKMIRKEPKFILTTVAHNEQLMAEAFRMGVSYFLLKPYDPQMLIGRVRQLVGISEPKENDAKRPFIDPYVPDYSETYNEVQIKEILRCLGFRLICEGIGI